MKKAIIVTLILAVVATISYFGYKAYQKSQDPAKA